MAHTGRDVVENQPALFHYGTQPALWIASTPTEPTNTSCEQQATYTWPPIRRGQTNLHNSTARREAARNMSPAVTRNTDTDIARFPVESEQVTKIAEDQRLRPNRPARKALSMLANHSARPEVPKRREANSSWSTYRTWPALRQMKAMKPGD